MDKKIKSWNEIQVKLVNDIIFNAIIHGADCGGSYDSNDEGLIESISQWLKFNNIQGYVLKRIDREGWIGIYQIVREANNG